MESVVRWRMYTVGLAVALMCMLMVGTFANSANAQKGPPSGTMGGGDGVRGPSEPDGFSPGNGAMRGNPCEDRADENASSNASPRGEAGNDVLKPDNGNAQGPKFCQPPTPPMIEEETPMSETPMSETPMSETPMSETPAAQEASAMALASAAGQADNGSQAAGGNGSQAAGGSGSQAAGGSGSQASTSSSSDGSGPAMLPSTGGLSLVGLAAIALLVSSGLVGTYAIRRHIS